MIISKDKSISITVGSNQKETIEDFVNAVIQDKANKPTTEINIDYYDELKAKADKWDEKETPVKPKLDEYLDSYCSKCGGMVENEYGQIFDYCPDCGQRVDNS